MRFASLAALAVLLCQSSCRVATAFVVPAGRLNVQKKTRRVLVANKEEIESSSSSDAQHIDNNNNDESEYLSEQEEIFLNQCKILCNERNLKLDHVKNARDLATVAHCGIQPGRVYRMGRISDASAKDIDLLLKDLDFKTLVDLRSPTELKDDPTLERRAVFGDFTSLVWSERGRAKDGCLRELKSGESPIKMKKNRRIKRLFGFTSNDDEVDDDDCDVCDNGSVPANQQVFVPKRKERHFVSLMNEFKYVKGTLSKLRKRDIARTVLKSPGALVSRRVRSNIQKPFLDEINDGGLPMLNELLLRFGAPGIKYVLDLVKQKSRHPIAFYCTAGKDRTGMIAAILLALAGVKEEDIVEDYTLSDNVYAEMNDHKAMVGALSQRNLDPATFLCAPPQVMRDTLETIREDYGSIEGYLDWIGFGPEDQKQLRDALLS